MLSILYVRLAIVLRVSQGGSVIVGVHGIHWRTESLIYQQQTKARAASCDTATDVDRPNWYS